VSLAEKNPPKLKKEREGYQEGEDEERREKGITSTTSLVQKKSTTSQTVLSVKQTWGRRAKHLR